jgi:hypothetical protein
VYLGFFILLSLVWIRKALKVLQGLLSLDSEQLRFPSAQTNKSVARVVELIEISLIRLRAENRVTAKKSVGSHIARICLLNKKSRHFESRVCRTATLAN